MNEAEITTSITNYLSALGSSCWWMKIKGGGFSRGGKQKPGVPDLVIVYQGRHVWVEVKTAKGKLEESQKREIPRLEAAGATVLVVRSLDELKEGLHNNDNAESASQ